MGKNLVIVESPAKAKTIEKFLGKDFHVMSSFGHIRDLKDKGLGIDIENNYKPEYEVSADKQKLVSELKKQAKAADVVWLASDEDREGEAIAWHLYEVLELDKKQTHRIVFHEITKNAILNAIETPRDIDVNLVNAQQARRVLDRIVGFEISPVLWRKIKPSLSAGRVQSVTVRLVVEREREIQHFQAEASFRVSAIFLLNNNENDNVELKAVLKNRFATEKEAIDFIEKCKSSAYNVEEVDTKPTHRSPSAPFTTSTLQQEASRKFGFPVAVTMRVAQQLYESGKITYMRTDSVNLSTLALDAAKEEIISMAGEKYYNRRVYNTKSKGAQEAHEAIRPTYMNQHQVEGTPQERKLYDLIWKRTIASQMAGAEFEKTTVTINIDNSDEKFVAMGEVLKFDGFLKIYMESSDDDMEENVEGMLPRIEVGAELKLNNLHAQEKFSQKPARYTEASLVRKLEELGIGRPSTYAPTISTIQNRSYVEKREIENEARQYRVITLQNGEVNITTAEEKATIEKGKLSPTDIGIVVNDYLAENFPNIMDYNFTATVEAQFDDIAEGNAVWTENIDSFYTKFHTRVEEAKNSTGKKVGERELGIDPKSGKPVFVKIGRFGPLAQIGLASDEEKPKFASLRTGQSIETVSLEEVLELFKLPIDLGEYEGENMRVGVGRFGHYVQFGKTYVSVPKGEDPFAITLQRAIELLEAKREADRNRVIMKFEAEDIEVLNGRFGAYIAHDGDNYKLPKGTVATELTLEKCKEIIADDSLKSKSKARTKAKTAAKKTATKKTTTKKTTAAKTTATKKKE